MVTKKETAITIAEPNKKEMTTVNKTAAELELYANTTTINSQPKLLEANDFLKRIKNGKDWVANHKKIWLDPISNHLKMLKELYKPTDDMLAIAERTLKLKILDYKRKIDEQTAVKKAEIEAKVEKGNISVDKAISQVQKVEEKSENFNVRKDKIVVITDATKIPREYLVPDTAKIKADLLNGAQIPGAEIQIRETIITR